MILVNGRPLFVLAGRTSSASEKHKAINSSLYQRLPMLMEPGRQYRITDLYAIIVESDSGLPKSMSTINLVIRHLFYNHVVDRESLSVKPAGRIFLYHLAGPEGKAGLNLVGNGGQSPGSRDDGGGILGEHDGQSRDGSSGQEEGGCDGVVL